MAADLATAIILAGAVAKGAYQAGVLSVVAERPMRIVRMVATSAGALNASVFATGLRHGRGREAAAEILRTWSEQASWWQVLRPTLHRGGVSSSVAVAALLRAAMDRLSRATTGTLAEITLQMVTSPLRGKANARGPRASLDGATTFEHVLEFAGPAFDDADRREQVIRAAAASAAFPLLFIPVAIDPVGPCVDGGAVNNTPVSYALESPEVRRVIVVTDNPLRANSGVAGWWFAMAGRLAEILINERLFRDLAHAERNNEKLARLDVLADAWQLTAAQRDELREALGWRPIELVQIRPAQALEGSPFSGLMSPALRRRYIEQGRRDAEAALGGPAPA